MKNDKKQNNTVNINKLLRRWLMLEHETCINILGGNIGMMFVCSAIIMFFSQVLKNALIALGIGVVLFCVLYVTCLSRVALYFSKIGRQMLQYGTITQMKKQIEESVLHSLYSNGEEIITPEFLFIIQSNKKGKKNYIQMIPLGEIREVKIGKITRYCNEFNEIFFKTYEEKEFSIRVYLNHKESEQLITNIISLGKDKAASISNKKRNRKKKKSILPFKEKTSHMYRYNGLLKQQNKYYRTQRYILKKYRIIWILFCLIAQILIILFVSLLVLMFLHNQDTSIFLKEEWNYIWQDPFDIILLLIVLAFALYGIPVLMLISAWIQFKKSIQRYEKLPYFTKEEIENQIIEPKSIEPLIFMEECFCFKDNRKMGFYNIISYADMVYCYPRMHGCSLSDHQTGTTVIMPITEFMIVFFTKDKKKYTIRFGQQEGLFWNCYKIMQRKAPHVKYGYQKKRRN